MPYPCHNHGISMAYPWHIHGICTTSYKAFLLPICPISCFTATVLRVGFRWGAGSAYTSLIPDDSYIGLSLDLEVPLVPVIDNHYGSHSNPKPLVYVMAFFPYSVGAF